MSATTNPRFLAYCRANGVDDPERMLEADTLRYPGGKMCGFIIWISGRWQVWRKANGHARFSPLLPEDVVAFDLWLSEGVS